MCEPVNFVNASFGAYKLIYESTKKGGWKHLIRQDNDLVEEILKRYKKVPGTGSNLKNATNLSF